jgi:hypothetical protein
MPAAGDLTLAPGAGHGEAGDAPQQGPAQERLNAPQPGQPKPANPEFETANTDDAAGAVIALGARRSAKREADAAAPETAGLVTVRPKPEKRKNAKERAKEKATEKYAKDGTTPDATAKAKSKVESKKARLEAKKAKKARPAVGRAG